ncbi:receptor-type tyrosine-protein phosphatase alpha-like [Zophobas morio]
MIFPFLVLVFLVVANCQEIISLQNETHFICVAENKDSVIYTKPPIVEDPKSTEVLFKHDFWHLKESQHVAHAPVTDKRWEGFKTIHTNIYNFSMFTSVSFSIYFSNIPCTVDFTIQVNRTRGNTTTTVNVTSWTHYTLHFENKMLTVYGNDSSLYSQGPCSSDPEVVVQTRYKTTWKIHKYRVRAPSEISTPETKVSVPPAISCLMFYVYLCPNCLLEIYTSEESIPTWIANSGSMTKNVLFKSQEVLIEVNTTLRLVRRTSGSPGKTYWGIDIRQCPNVKLNKTIYKVKLNNNDRGKYRTCELLSPKRQEQTKIPDALLDCKPGFLGRGCDLSCEELLGPKTTYCENYKICAKSSLNSSCVCSWGFQEPSCVEPCVDGRWGLSCRNTCSNCPTCDKMTGKCIKADTTTKTTIPHTTTLREISQSENLISPTLLPSSFYPSSSTPHATKVRKPESSTYPSRILPSLNDTIIFSNIPPPTTIDSTKAYFVFTKNDFIKSTNEVIAYALILLKEHVDIQTTNRSWNGTYKTWPPIPKNSIQLTPKLWNPFTDDQHTCHFIIGANNSCCKEHCHYTPLKPNTRYWLMVRALTNQNYNDSSLLFFQTASEDSFSIYYISLGVLILVMMIMVVLFYIIYTIRRRNNQATIIQEEEMRLRMKTKPLETTVIDFNSLQNHCSQPTFLTTLKIQFNAISDPMPHSSFRIGLQPNNINKNRDRNRVIPYDSNRVVLKPMKSVGTEDYINASYIDGYNRPKAYIACQSPKFSTIKDFWRMIWQENVSVIIMATNFIERKKRMCAEYWPQRASAVHEYGKIIIKLRKETTFELYAYQELEIAYGDKSKIIHHIHIKWRFDDSNMVYPNDVLPVVKLIRQQYDNPRGPIVFHSGYGTGRVGILILCDLALQMISKENKVDFFSLTKTLRDQRASMITNVEHYIFSHLLMNEYYLEHSSPFQYSIGQNIKHDDIKQQFKYLETLRHYDNIFQEVSLQYCIPRHPFESVIVARYGQRRKYFISREPKEEQLIDFWKMVARESICWVLFLNKKFLVTTHVSGSLETINITRNRVVNTTYGLMTEGSLLIYNTISKEKIYDGKLYIFQFNNWKVNQLVPNSVHSFISLLNHLHRDTDKEKLVLVSCSDGFTACGLFVVFSYIVEKYENELEIDVCNAIRLARRSGRSFVNRTKQLTFIYECIRDYIENYDKYQQIVVNDVNKNKKIKQWRLYLFIKSW